MRHALLCLGVLWLCAGCAEPGEARLGASGEVCQADNDCRQELLCVRQLCRAPEETPLLYDCSQLCEYLEECNIEASDVCQEQCAEATEDWSAQEFNELGRCIFAQSCQALRQGEQACQDL
jgi:hypothetical protein